MNFRQHIPNLITLGNLLCGCIALVAANSDIKLSVFFVLLAAILDFFDGLVARMLRVSSPLGKQLDSLADLVSFGLVPAYWLYLTLQPLLFSDSILFQHSVVVSTIELIIFCSVLAGAWRLARFNIDSTQNSFFRGLPIPANGLFWVSIMMSQDIFISIDNHSLIVLFLTLSVAISFLMVSTIRLL
ncbi:MAG: CDP-alcohol phosphatidyltransferase family protein, partial [Crocinitomicaceae bacterium]|nr:CDP-alcohol phosphatidyltransferase family protein [Crocinitomicaceae bacterium]